MRKRLFWFCCILLYLTPAVKFWAIDFYKVESKLGHSVYNHHYAEVATHFKTELAYNKKPKRQILQNSNTNSFVIGFLVNLLSCFCDTLMKLEWIFWASIQWNCAKNVMWLGVVSLKPWQAVKKKKKNACCTCLDSFLLGEKYFISVVIFLTAERFYLLVFHRYISNLDQDLILYYYIWKAWSITSSYCSAWT